MSIETHMSPQTEVQLLAALVAAACALPGVFLVLRRTAMVSDAISHTIIFGIVVVYLITRDIASPLLLVGATLTGVLTVWLVEVLTSTRRVKEDAAIGLVFPFLFSLAVILISRFAGNAHLDNDAVLLGEIAFAPFDRLALFGFDLPRAVWVMSGILLVNLLFIGLFYKELQLTTFDAALAAALGFSPALLHYSLMTLVSLTAVGAFDAVGAILVIALMIAPPATAYLLTDRLPVMLGLSMLIGALSAIAGYWLARTIDTNISAAMATMVGVTFVLTFILAPQRGIIAVIIRQKRQRWIFAQQILTIHLMQHEGRLEEASESQIEHLSRHMQWAPAFAAQVVRRAEQARLVRRDGEQLHLTEQGRAVAAEAFTR